MRAAPSRVPTEAAAWDMRASAAGSDRSGRTCASTQSGVKSASATTIPPPAATTPRTLTACSPLPTGYGT